MVEALLERVEAALAERDGARRHRVVQALRRGPGTVDGAGDRTLDDAVTARVERALRDDVDLGARTAGVEVAVALGPAMVPLMARLIVDRNARVRRLAIDVLGGLGAHGGPALLPAFDDPLLAVRASAVDAWARAMGSAGIPRLLELLAVPETSPSVALAALIGLDAARATCPRTVLRVWLAEPTTAGAALRLAGRAGDLEAVLPALTSTSGSRRRAALLGLAEALEQGAGYADVPGARAVILAAVADADDAVAGAAVVVLAHAADVAAIADVAVGHDAARLLGALHRAVAILPAHARRTLVDLLRSDATPGEVCRELLETARRLGDGGRSDVVIDARRRFDPVGYAAVAAWFERRLGLELGSDAHQRLRARLAPRIEATGARGVEAYLERLARDPIEAAVADDAVTIHETYFFRERPVLASFRHEIIPALAVGRRCLRVWSAGCSTGEEAFSLGALLEDAVRAGVIDDWRVVGSDVSAAVIARAREMRFGRRSFREPPDEIERAALIWDGDTARPVDRLRERVSFRVANLLDDDKEEHDDFDAIVCRNVFIYLGASARARLVQRFFDGLVPGGALVLGHSESLLYVDSPFTLWPVRRGLAYRKGDP